MGEMPVEERVDRLARAREEFSIENRVSWNKDEKNTSGWQRKRIWGHRVVVWVKKSTN